MGVTVKCKKTGYSIDLGYSGFFRLRSKVAWLYSEEFGKHYAELFAVKTIEMDAKEREAWYEAYDNKTINLIQSGHLDIKIADFCYQSDTVGEIRYGACKNILKAIGEYDDDVLYGYCGRADCAKFRDFKRILQECVNNKSSLVWN